MGEGNTDKEIAGQLKMSIRTVQDRVYKMMKTWECKNRTQLVLKVVMFNIGSFAGK